jgi:hypothetical protein
VMGSGEKGRKTMERDERRGEAGEDDGGRRETAGDKGERR